MTSITAGQESDTVMLATEKDGSDLSPASPGLQNVQILLTQASGHALNNILSPRASNIAAAALVS